MSELFLASIRATLLPLAALLLIGSHAMAGDRVHTRPRPAAQPQPAATPPVRTAMLPLTVSIMIAAPSTSMLEEAYVSLRGPDGQLRRFPVEGGHAAIHYRQTILRPGESLTVLWTPAK